MENRTPFQILLQLRMLDSGIVPHESSFGDIRGVVKAHMVALAPEERRKSARKFRKLWRKASKQALARAHTSKGHSRYQKIRRQNSIERLEEKVKNLHCTGTRRPTSRQSRERSYMVMEMMARMVHEEFLCGDGAGKAKKPVG